MIRDAINELFYGRFGVTDFRAVPLPAGVGKEIMGLKLDAEVAPDIQDKLKAEWYDAGILLFRGAATSEEEHLRLSRCFGTLEPHPIEAIRIPEYPELIQLSNEFGLRGPVYDYGDGVPNYGAIPWHTDLAFEVTPNAGALLRMVRKATVGGQTSFLDTALAYDAMDEAFKQRIDGLEARFEFCADRSKMRFCNPGGKRIGESKAAFFPDYLPVIRPLVWAHPASGRKIINVCPLNIQAIVGMEQAESDALIQELLDHVIDDRFVYTHNWEKDDVMLWDNYRMMHRASGHPVDVIRTAQRTTIKGLVPAGRALEVKEVEPA